MGSCAIFRLKKFFKKTFKILLTKGGFSRIINIVVREQTKAKNKICGCSSSGRAPPCQGGGSEFEPRHPLQVLRQSRNRLSFLLPQKRYEVIFPREFAYHMLSKSDILYLLPSLYRQGRGCLHGVPYIIRNRCCGKCRESLHLQMARWRSVIGNEPKD